MPYNLPRTLAYSILDVFADTPLAGNPLAVFHDARGLTTEHMQSLAREPSLSETTFILPAEDPATEAHTGVRVRIFTTQQELPFAGHPTLGTAAWLHLHHAVLRGATRITLALQAGSISVTFREPAPGEPGVFGSMRQLPPTFGESLLATTIAPLLGLTPEDLHPRLSAHVVSTGIPWLIVPLASVAALEHLALAPHLVFPFLATHGATGIYCIAPTSEPFVFRTRSFFTGGEDPATGSAAGCAIALLVRGGTPSSQPVTFLQGIEMLRPSRIEASALLTGTDISAVFVGGRTIPVASGHFSVHF